MEKTELSGKPTQGELDMINRYTRRQLSQEEVYVFPVVLCDNELDRDHERFSDEAIDRLAELFVGVTGIADHKPLSSNQTARIFMCRPEPVAGRTTSDGRPYKRLYAKAYLPRCEQTEGLILALDSGIKKEVSVGCSVKKRTCSVCGRDISECKHIKGRKYSGKTCFVTLEEPVDVYEWSFVAVPAQKAAGVVKAFDAEDNNLQRTGGSKVELKQKLFSKTEQSFSAEELELLCKQYDELERRAMDGDYYRGVLTKDISSLALIALPKLRADVLQKMTSELSVRELDELKTALRAKAGELVPMQPQLMKAKGSGEKNNILYNNI